MIGSKSLLNIVSIGGGTGLSCLLKGLKHRVLQRPFPEAPRVRPWISRLTAVVTVTDDGGSSGRLRDEFQVLPPGDIRNCLVALSADESLMSQLFQFRFRGTGQLKGHSFGNLFLTALSSVTGDFLTAIRLTSEVLAIRGQIFPATLQDVKLTATMESGLKVVGESSISQAAGRIRRVSLSPRSCKPVRGALQAIREADIITLGPGSLFTSLLPNLLVSGIADAIRRSRALKIYVGNLMTQPGETTDFTMAHHLEIIQSHAGAQLFDLIVLNHTPIPPQVLQRYRRQAAHPVTQDLDKIRKMGLHVYHADLLAKEKVVRHDPNLLANAVYHAHRMWNARKSGTR